MDKAFKLSKGEITRLIPDLGFAFVTDKIAVDGRKVDYMFRNEPESEGDSGWVFYGGGETQDYIDDPNNTSLLSLNTIANYDPEIIGFLTYPPGTEIERKPDGRLQVISGDVDEPKVILQTPVGPGVVHVTDGWSFSADDLLLRRVDGDSLVLWRPGITLWISVYNSDNPDIESRMDTLLEHASPDRTDLQRSGSDQLGKMSYRLVETVEGQNQSAVYMFGFGKTKEIHLSVYFDDESFLGHINKIWDTLTYTGL
ncbi:DUF2185 domain-containing protein [Marinobacter zhejiangensis]|uniref:Immunity protein Imm33 domain-containing protein n=1 Tax=Marinobacter zhejiangensis TaxID=488535 RepID=A0A1I4T386_9GAMM|nr:DUF2185 domain-containing protein [Marinobacter zhejiangensis]SFM71218.1 hypothetical protein SAMN04487963_3472 [Marinobacter zhejiangensis]